MKKRIFMTERRKRQTMLFSVTRRWAKKARLYIKFITETLNGQKKFRRATFVFTSKKTAATRNFP